jgi:hypothetical protein
VELEHQQLALAKKVMGTFKKVEAKTPSRMPLEGESENARVGQLWQQYCDRLELVPIGSGALRVSVYKLFDRSDLIQNNKAELILPIYPNWCYPVDNLRIVD